MVVVVVLDESCSYHVADAKEANTALLCLTRTGNDMRNGETAVPKNGVAIQMLSLFLLFGFPIVKHHCWHTC